MLSVNSKQMLDVFRNRMWNPAADSSNNLYPRLLVSRVLVQSTPSLSRRSQHRHSISEGGNPHGSALIKVIKPF